MDEAPNKIYLQAEYIKTSIVMDAIKLAYGKVSKDPFDCSEAFEELITKIESL